jgi:hypothetical protein
MRNVGERGKPVLTHNSHVLKKLPEGINGVKNR